MKFTLHERAFHPDENFGLGGFWFDGDSRGFSFLPRGRVTSRVGVLMNIDAKESDIEAPSAYSDPSTSPLGGYFSVHEKYEQEGTRPQAVYLSKSISRYTPDSIQNISLVMHSWGKNHAARPTQDYVRDDGASKLEPVIPNLDITLNFTMRIDLHRKKILIESTLRGDGFPNSEVFIRDSADTPIMLNTHHRIGVAAGQLFGNHNHMLASTEIEIDCDESANFVGPIKAMRSVNFMPYDYDLLGVAGTTDFDIPGWNNLHISRDPSVKNMLGMDSDNGAVHEFPYTGRHSVDEIFDEVSMEDLSNWDYK
ncbi:hypothetical protein [Paracoccus fistulariae]|uniref:Uncharacterized protein n=1 Tax=Paracoccus fistulariae TaxID=658446 RepID=A0ABY7SHT2_9RHOB|nr:hypothetical protein [Paracoccus fistulariae]MDB6183279.1 hypothetical protein [Paracoccus fistulariae]WCR06555.1 hypothetical protein JHX87_13855 [Paracoccus fistulariae]